MIELLLSSALALALSKPAPVNEITCTADVFSSKLEIPKLGVLPFVFSLKSDQVQNSWKKNIEKLELLDPYKRFFTPYWISPDITSDQALPTFPKKIIKAHHSIENGNIEFILTRFAEADHRTAGMSLEFNTPRGFYAAILLDKEKDGPVKKILAPIKFDEETAILSIDCMIKD